MTLWCRIRAVLRRSDPEPVEWLLGTRMAVFGIWYLMPWDVWPSYAVGAECCERGAYTLTRAVWASEDTMGVAFVALGLGHAACAFWRAPVRLRIALAAAAVACWWLIAVSFTLWRWQSTAVPAYLLDGMGHLWLVARHVAEIRSGARHGRR